MVKDAHTPADLPNIVCLQSRAAAGLRLPTWRAPMKTNDTSRVTAETMPAVEDSRASDAITGIETGLYDLRNMTDITAQLLEEAIAGNHQHITGHRDKYHLTERQRDRLLFAAYHALRLAEELIADFDRRIEA